MACEGKVLDLNGRELVPSFQVEENATQLQIQDSLKQSLLNLSEPQLKALKSNLDNLDTKTVDITEVKNLLQTDITPIGILNINDLKKLQFAQESYDEIQAKIQYLQLNNESISVLMVETEDLSIQSQGSPVSIDGTVFQNEKGVKYMVIRRNEDTEALAKIINHELTHVVMDQLISSNSYLQDSLNKLYDSLKRKKPNDTYIKDVLSRLSNDSRPTEVYAWIFGDQKMYDWVKGQGTLQFNEINDIVNQTPQGALRNPKSISEPELTASKQESVNFYNGFIEADDDAVFVFGSNGASYNGNPLKGTGGAALSALQQGRLEQNENMANTYSKNKRSYGIQTVTKPGARKSLSSQEIINNITKFYEEASNNPDQIYKVAYTDVGSKTSLNGYSGDEMIDMFIAAGPIPSNVQFSNNWENTGKFNEQATEINDNSFAHSNQEALEDFDMVTSSTLASLLEYKERTLEELKANNKAIHNELTKAYANRVKNNTLAIEYSEAINVEGSNVKLYGVKTNDIVQIPFDEGRYWKTWKNYFTETEMAKLWPDYKTFKDNDYVTISMKKLHDTFEGVTGITNSKLINLLEYINKDRGKEKPYWQRVKNYPVVYIIKNKKTGKPQVRVPYTISNKAHIDINGNVTKAASTYEILKDFDFSDVVGLRKFIGNINPNLKVNDIQKTALAKFISELDPSAVVTYEQGMDFDDSSYDYFKQVEFARNDGSGTFTSTYIQTKNNTQIGGIKGHFGTLNKVLKTVDSGTFVKFSNGKSADGKHIMQYGIVIGNGASGLVLAHFDGSDIKLQNVPYSKITEIFLPKGTNAEIFNDLANSSYIQFNNDNRSMSVKTERRSAFSKYMQGLYKNKGKDITLYDFDYLKSKHPDNFQEFKNNILNRVKTGSVVKYVNYKNGQLREEVGTFFFNDGKYTHVLNGYGDIIKIANSNEVTPYDKIKKTREFIKGQITDAEGKVILEANNYALDVIFSDMSREAQFVDYLKGIKLYIQSQYSAEGTPETKPLDKLKEDLANNKITANEYLLIYKQLQLTDAKSLNDVVDVVEFTNFSTIEAGGKTTIDGEVNDLLTQQEKEIQLSQLQIGDLVHYFNINDKNNVYRNWSIVVDIDNETELLIMSQERNNPSCSAHDNRPSERLCDSFS